MPVTLFGANGTSDSLEAVVEGEPEELSGTGHEGPHPRLSPFANAAPTGAALGPAIISLGGVIAVEAPVTVTFKI